jgi:hypothetical protein
LRLSNENTTVRIGTEPINEYKLIAELSRVKTEIET